MRITKTISLFHIITILLIYNAVYSQSRVIEAPISKTLNKTASNCVALYPIDTNNQVLRYATAFFINETQIVTSLTNVQGIKDGFIILKNGKTKLQTKHIIAVDEINNIIILEIEKKAGKPIGFADLQELPEEGSFVYIVGHPQLGNNQISSSKITQVCDTLQQTILKLSSPIAPITNGGMALNADGKIIGIVCSSVVNQQYISYIRPISFVSELLSETQTPKILKILPPDTIIKIDTTYINSTLPENSLNSYQSSSDSLIEDSHTTINITDSLPSIDSITPPQILQIDTFITILWTQDSTDYIREQLNLHNKIGISPLKTLDIKNERWQINDSSYFKLVSIEILNNCNYSISNIVLLFLIYNNNGTLINKATAQYLTPYSADNNLKLGITRQLNDDDKLNLIKSEDDDLEIRVVSFDIHKPF